MNKEAYERAETEIIRFNAEDIIITSESNTPDPNEGGMVSG